MRVLNPRAGDPTWKCTRRRLFSQRMGSSRSLDELDQRAGSSAFSPCCLGWDWQSGASGNIVARSLSSKASMIACLPILVSVEATSTLLCAASACHFAAAGRTRDADRGVEQPGGVGVRAFRGSKTAAAVNGLGAVQRAAALLFEGDRAGLRAVRHRVPFLPPFKGRKGPRWGAARRSLPCF